MNTGHWILTALWAMLLGYYLYLRRGNKMLRQLRRWGACEDGYAFAERCGATTLSELWEKLERPDWMIWLLSNEGHIRHQGQKLYHICAWYWKQDKPRRDSTYERCAWERATADKLRKMWPDPFSEDWK